MTFEHITTILELALFVLIVIQGEYIRYYEREVHRIQSQREKERATWREQKRKQTSKKADTSTSTQASAKAEESVAEKKS